MQSGNKFLLYCMGIAKEFQARLSRMQVFVKHNLSSGTANEVILREFLLNHSPGDYEVGQGFICDPFGDKGVSKQCDILVYDKNHYPLVYADGPIRIVLPAAAAMVIEVKTNFSVNDVQGSILNIESARKMNRYTSGVIFAFKSPKKLDNILRNIQNTLHLIDVDNSPTAILLLDKGLIIYRWSWLRHRDEAVSGTIGDKSYGVRIAKDDESAIVMTILLLLFFEKVSSGIYETDFINQALQVFEQYTERLPDIDIPI